MRLRLPGPRRRLDGAGRGEGRKLFLRHDPGGRTAIACRGFPRCRRGWCRRRVIHGVQGLRELDDHVGWWHRGFAGRGRVDRFLRGRHGVEGQEGQEDPRHQGLVAEAPGRGRGGGPRRRGRHGIHSAPPRHRGAGGAGSSGVVARRLPAPPDEVAAADRAPGVRLARRLPGRPGRLPRGARFGVGACRDRTAHGLRRDRPQRRRCDLPGGVATVRLQHLRPQPRRPDRCPRVARRSSVAVIVAIRRRPAALSMSD
mmetsp:Transcript_7683/g.21871  ORF Transcript_7683/g.21871 Transcript_7683/m.21871 type:complete len:256 (+) Transcript_7683:1459-2226(+)